MGIRVLVVDDHRIIREGLRLLFVHEPELELVGEAANGEEALAMVEQLHPEVVLMDIGLPVVDGLEATTTIRASHPEIKVIALTMHADRYYIGLMREAGAQGYVLKETAFEVLADTIRKVMAGETCYPE